MGVCPAKPPIRFTCRNDAAAALRAAEAMLRASGMSFREFSEALAARTVCSYCGTVLKGERCRNCGAPR
jgi:rubrerythrin